MPRRKTPAKWGDLFGVALWLRRRSRPKKQEVQPRIKIGDNFFSLVLCCRTRLLAFSQGLKGRGDAFALPQREKTAAKGSRPRKFHATARPFAHWRHTMKKRQTKNGKAEKMQLMAMRALVARLCFSSTFFLIV